MTADDEREVEEWLEWMNTHMEPPTRQQVREWFGIGLEDFPRFAQAGLERELEKYRKMLQVYSRCDDPEFDDAGSQDRCPVRAGAAVDCGLVGGGDAAGAEVKV